MSQSPCFGTFIFYSADGRFAVPPGAEKATRRVPPKPANLKAKLPTHCGAVVPTDAKDEDIRQILVLNTNLFASSRDWELFRDSEIGMALWDACDNAVVYRIDAPRGGGRTMMSGGGVPPKPATEKRRPKKGPAKASKRTVKTTAKKIAKKVTKSKAKKSKKPMQTLSRGGVPPKKAND